MLLLSKAGPSLGGRKVQALTESLLSPTNTFLIFGYPADAVLSLMFNKQHPEGPGVQA